MKAPGVRKEAMYGDEYTPLHYDRQFKAHDERQDLFYRKAIFDEGKANEVVNDNISEPILKKKRQVSFHFENSQPR